MRTVPLYIEKDGKKILIGTAEVDDDSSQATLEIDPEPFQKMFGHDKVNLSANLGISINGKDITDGE